MDISLEIARQAQEVSQKKSRPKREMAYRKEGKDRIREYQEEFIASHELLPVACYSCGKRIHNQTQIEEFIKTSDLFKEKSAGREDSKGMQGVYELAGATRLCCRRMYLTSPLIIGLIDEREQEIDSSRRLAAGGRGDFLHGPLVPHRDPILPRRRDAPRLGTLEGHSHRETAIEQAESVEDLTMKIGKFILG